MMKLDEKRIIEIFQKEFGYKTLHSEDVECFKIGSTNIIANTDTLVESTDIPPSMDLEAAARKGIVSCVSDFAAKGVKPLYGIVSITIPKRLTIDKVRQIAKGIAKAAKEFNFVILGGDTNEGREIVLQVTIFGKAKKIIERKGAKIGDSIFVTGPFGYTASGLKILLGKKYAERQFSKIAIKAVNHPSARMEFGIKIKNIATSSMDSSDGLSTCLNEMSKQNKKKFLIDKLPTDDKVREFAKHNKLNMLDLVFNGGEEFEIIFTAPKKSEKRLRELAAETKTPLIKIGSVYDGKGVFFKDGEKRVRITDGGWSHFS